LRMRGRLLLLGYGLACALLIPPLAAQKIQQPALTVSGYIIDAEIDPAAHHLAAKVVVSFTVLESTEPVIAEPVSFGLHSALRVSRISDETGRALISERAADGTIRVTPATPLANGRSSHWTFQYEGAITGNEYGAVNELRLAAIEEPTTWLLYSARWLPVSGDLPKSLTDRFTAEMHIRVPEGMQVFASGEPGTLNSDGEPRWTKVWSRIALGNIYDLTGQRDRAVHEYQMAVQTNDNAQGAVNKAQVYLQKQYTLPAK